jgi:excisionase family DNA binding protein
MSEPEPERYLNEDDAPTRLRRADWVARLLDVKPWRVYELVRQNAIPYVRIGVREVRFDEEAVLAWIKAGGKRITPSKFKMERIA